MNTQNNTKTCPQCDGAGQEILGVAPKVCRKCHGHGVITSIPKSATFMDGGTQLEKYAQNAWDEDVAEENQDGSGTGFDELVVNVGSLSDDDLKLSIMQFMKTMDNNQITQLFERMFVVLGTNMTEIKNQVSDAATGNLNISKVSQHMAETIDSMNSDQLKAMFCEARKFT